MHYEFMSVFTQRWMATFF